MAGITNAEKVRTDLFNTLNNPGKISVNLISDADVSMVSLDGKTILMVQIPAATRKQKPIYLNGQPLGNTYRRLHEGDRSCDDETVKRMLAEQLDDSRDTRIIDKFGIQDLDLDSLHAVPESGETMGISSSMDLLNTEEKILWSVLAQPRPAIGRYWNDSTN